MKDFLLTKEQLSMKNQFEQSSIDRAQTNSFKWQAKELKINGKDLYPMWVADMEFESSPAIQKRLAERVEEGIFGYEMLSDKYYEAIKYWLNKRHDCELENDQIFYCANMMCGLSVILQTFTQENDEVLMNVPTYGNFYHTIQGCKRVVVESELKEINQRFTFDLTDMEQKVTGKTRAFLLCNPQNPTGTVWTEEELEQICQFCKKHHLFIISDEAHYDFVFYGKHTMMRKISEKYQIPTITMVSPGKSFNVAGVQNASLLVDGIETKKALMNTMNAMAYPFEHAFAEAVTIGAYMESEDWFDEVYNYIKCSKDMVIRYIKENIPMLRVPDSAATYLLWIDCRGMKMEEDEIMQFWKNECGILPSDGREFGDAGKQYIRLNLACSRKIIERILENIKDGFKKLTME